MQADYVIVGAGSAGCALAYRLSEDGRFKVLVVEAGGSDVGPFIRMPAALSYPMNMARYDWGYRSEPEPGLNGRRLACPRGKVVGGSSSINGMVYVRGHPKDFDHWRDQGAAGWGYADVLPYFKRMEDWDPGPAELAGPEGQPDPAWRGQGGPLAVTRGPRTNLLYRAFVEAGRQAGYPLNPDYNGARQEGFGPMEMTVKDGVRWSATRAYLEPALKRQNCELVRAKARRVVFEGRRAVGVEVERGGKIETIRAGAEVILAASSINSPALLKLSGVGPAEELRSHGIPVLADRPGVGENLQDHLELYVQQACVQPITLYSHLNWPAKLRIGLEWTLFKSGLGATNHFEACAFLKSRPDVGYPDVQYHFLPVAIRYDGKAPAEGHGFQAHVGPMRSKSRGSVTLRSPDPNDAPVIRFNYLSHEDDLPDFRRCVRMTREIFAQGAFDPFRGAELAPGPKVESDDELDAYIREHAESAYHPCGTCKMGAPDDPRAVVDPECRVIGVEALRVADSSVFPRITNGNLNAPSIMTGEKAADYVLGLHA